MTLSISDLEIRVRPGGRTLSPRPSVDAMKTQRTLPLPDPESEDFVRQYVLRLLISTFGYAAADIECEFPIHIGSKRVYVDIAVFPRGARHTQKNIYILLDCKPMDFLKQEAALRQVLWFMSACEGVKYGVLATELWTVLDKHMVGTSDEPPTIPALIGAAGDPVVIVYDPRRQIVKPTQAPAPAARPSAKRAPARRPVEDDDFDADLPRPRRFRTAFRLVGVSTMLLALLFTVAIAIPRFNPAERLSPARRFLRRTADPQPSNQIDQRHGGGPGRSSGRPGRCGN
ncbi:MAG: type I restriction enzyme HsdR N-terminal domain-containing protein [Chloroflexi bacterium]|nr:type I restriction enzyme HsdR N-terminal domain-containing protein [Chloroflexota bacterium]